MKLSEKLVDMIEEAEFSIYYEDENNVDFGKFSSRGQDFHFSLNTGNNLDTFLYNIFECYQNFDVSEEAYLWLDSSGHGKNGAPYDMLDVYKDMEECRDFINELYSIVDAFLALNI